MDTDYRMVFNPRGALLQSARDCEAEVFLRWYGNTRAELEQEYGPYEERSVFLVIADRHDEVTAAMRLIAPGGAHGLKTLNDIGRPPWEVDGRRSAMAAGIDIRSTWEVATLGVRRRGRAHEQHQSVALYHGLGAVHRANGMSAFVAILDDTVRRLLGSVGLITQVLPGTRSGPYLGSVASTPVYAHCAQMVDNQRRRFPDAHRLVTLGVGLDGIEVPAPDAFRLSAPTRTPVSV